MRISDWSSDVCSSDLNRPAILAAGAGEPVAHRRRRRLARDRGGGHVVEQCGLSPRVPGRAGRAASVWHCVDRGVARGSVDGACGGTRLGPPTGKSGGTVLQAAALVGGAGAERRATEDDVRMTEFSAWIGRSEERRDRLDASRSAVLLAAIGQPEAPGDGDPLPPLHHWLHFWDAKTPEQTGVDGHPRRSEEHTPELQSLMRLSYAVFCLK